MGNYTNVINNVGPLMIVLSCQCLTNNGFNAVIIPIILNAFQQETQMTQCNTMNQFIFV